MLLFSRSRRLSFTLCTLVLSASAWGQDYSTDGRRWVEVEVTVYQTVRPATTELANPGKLDLGYLPRPRLLAAADTSYAYPFPADQPALLPPGMPLSGQLSATPPPLEFGAPYSPALPGSFKVLDYDRDPYIALDSRSWGFTGINRNLEQSGDYKVLWHQVWRQPLLERGQVSAVAVLAGEEVSGHHQLEGSLRLSDAGNQARLDLSLWLTEFALLPANATQLWHLPAVPAALVPAAGGETAAAGTLVQNAAPSLPALVSRRGPTKIWQLQATRELGSNELYYLDHPVLGVLIETRPYQLPELDSPEPVDDF